MTITNNAARDAQRRKEINDYLRAQRFDESSIQEAIDTEKRQNRVEGKYLIIYEDYTRHEDGKEFLMSCKKNELYPGMLLIVDKNLGSMTPTEVGLPRGKVQINIATFPNSIKGGNTRTVIANRNGNLEDPVNDAISDIVESFATSGRVKTADFRDTTVEAMSTDELSIKMNCSSEFTGIKAGASLEHNKSSYSKYFMTDYTQVFYTASAEYDKNDLSSLFADTVTVDQIRRAFGGQPVIFVRSVNYGRQLYLLEEMSGSHQSMIQSASVSGYGISVDQNLTKSSSNVKYKKEAVCRGGDVTNANVIFGTEIPKKQGETPIEYCIRQINEVRGNVRKFKMNHTSINLDGRKTSDVNGVILSYKAMMIAGINPRDVTFWKSGRQKVKRIIPNNGFKLDVFNTMKDHNIMVGGYYTMFDSYGNELPTRHYLFPEKGKMSERRVYNKKNMSPTRHLPTNVYRVFLTIRHRDKDRIFSHNYILPCADIYAAYMRQGAKGGETINWFFGSTEDSWYND